KRLCCGCGAEIGRTRNSKPGRTEGFCSKSRLPFSFVPALRQGDLVSDQYRVAGCLAYGGLGWIYLATDERVADRWVVLKGLLNTRDPEAMAAALAERQFLARVEHPNVVRIYNFVQHAGAGYIVMEYVGGRTLRDVVEERRRGGLGPLPLELAIAYVLGVLPAFRHGAGRRGPRTASAPPTRWPSSCSGPCARWWRCPRARRRRPPAASSAATCSRSTRWPAARPGGRSGGTCPRSASTRRTRR